MTTRRDFLSKGLTAAIGGAALLKTGKLFASLDLANLSVADHKTGDWQNHAVRRALGQARFAESLVSGNPDFLLFSGSGHGRFADYGDRTFLTNAGSKQAVISLNLPGQSYGYSIFLNPGESTVPENLLTNFSSGLYSNPGPAVMEIRVDGVAKDQVKVAGKTIGWNPDLLGTIGTTSPKFNPDDVIAANLFGGTRAFTTNGPVLKNQYQNFALYSPTGANVEVQGAINGKAIMLRNAWIPKNGVIQLNDFMYDDASGFASGVPNGPLFGKSVWVAGFADGDIYGLPIVMNKETGDGFADTARSIALSKQFGSSMTKEDFLAMVANGNDALHPPSLTTISESTAKELKQYSARRSFAAGQGTGQQRELWVSGYCEGVAGASGVFQSYLGITNQGNNGSIFSDNVITAFLPDGTTRSGVASLLAGRRYVFDDLLAQLGLGKGVATLHITSNYGMQIDAHTLNESHSNVGDRNAYWTLDDLIKPGYAGLLASVGESGDPAYPLSGATTNLQFFAPPEYSPKGANVNITANDQSGKLVASKNLYVPAGKHIQCNVRNFLGIPYPDQYFVLQTQLKGDSPFFAGATRMDNASKDWVTETASPMKL